MNRAFVVCLLLQAVAARNISISIGRLQENPADVTYVEGKAPDELKAGPAKNSTKPKETVAEAAFIRSSSRDIPKDDEVENEEFERFIKTHHNRPTIETVFVSSSPSPLYDDGESEEFNEESSSLRSQAEFFKRPAKNQTFERSVALPTVASSILTTSDHGHIHSIDNHHAQGASVDIGGGGISYAGGDGIIVQGDGGQFSAFANGQYLPSFLYAGGDQQFYQISQPVPAGGPGVVAVPSPVPRIINVPQHSLKTKTYEIRRPAIQKHYYDIEERVIIRPAGSIVVELNRPVAKIPTGETIVALGGLQGGFNGVGFQQGAIRLQGGSSGTGLQQSQGGIGILQGGSQGGLFGLGIQQSQGGIGITEADLQRAISGLGLQQSQGGIGVSQGGPQGGLAGLGIQQSQGGIGITEADLQRAISGLGPQQSQGAIGTSPGGPQGGIAGLGIQQSQGGLQGAVGISQGGPQGGLAGLGIQQSQGGIGITEADLQRAISGLGPQQSQGAIGTSQGGSQQSQGAIGISQGGPQGGLGGLGIQQSQGGIGITEADLQRAISGLGPQQSQGAIGTSPGGPQGGIAGLGIQQSQGGLQGAVGISQGGPQGGLAGLGIQQSQGGIGITEADLQRAISGLGPQQSQGAIGTSQGGPQGGLAGLGIQQSRGGSQQSQGAIGISQGGPQGGLGGLGIQQSQGSIGLTQDGSQPGFVRTGFQQTPDGTIYSTTLTSYNPSAAPTTTTIFRGPQGGFLGTFAIPSSVGIGGAPGTGFQQSQGAIGVSQGGSQGGIAGVGIQQSQGGFYSTTPAPSIPPASPTPPISIGGPQGGPIGSGFQQSQGAIGISQGGPQGGIAGVGIQLSQGGFYSTTPAPYFPPANGGPQGGATGSGFQQSQGAIGISQGGPQGGVAGVGIQQSQGGFYSTTPAPYFPAANGGPQGGAIGSGFQQSQGAIGVSQGGPQGGIAGVGIQQSQGGFYSTTPLPYLPPASPTPTIAIGGPQGGVSGSGFQQSQGAIAVSQGGPQGGVTGVGIQQSQGGIISSTTAAPTPTGAIGGSQGGFSGPGFQQPQGGVSFSTTFATPTSTVGIVGSQGGVSGAGFQQSQGAIGVSQGGPQGGFTGIGIQQSQGGIVSSTTAPPYLPPVGPQSGFIASGVQQSVRPTYASVSTTTAGSAIAGANDDSVVVEASANVRNRGTFSSTTTTERSFTSTVNQDASAYARARAQAASRSKTPFMIAVGEPDFHYPPYVEINSNGSPLGHLRQLQATSQPYPRMRHQGQLLTEEVRNDDEQQQTGYGALSRNIAHQNTNESPAEIPPNTPQDEQSIRSTQESSGLQPPSFAYQPPATPQYHYVGSTQQPLQVSQISSGAYQQPSPLYQHHFIRTTSQPIQIAELAHLQQYQAPQQHVAALTQEPIQVTKYSTRTHQPIQLYQIFQQPANDPQLHQQHAAKYRSSAHQRPNLVAMLRHQQLHDAKLTQQPVQEAQSVAEVTQKPNEVVEVRSSTHPSFEYQYQPVLTTQQPETYTTGRRLYQQSALPSKYTQHHTINVAPSQHTILFRSNQQQPEKSGRSQNLETLPEPEVDGEEVTVRSTSIESSTSAAVTSSTTSAPTPSQVVAASQPQTYATVLANRQPGILYASSGPTFPRHHPSHTLRFVSEGSSLFSPSGRHLHLASSQPSRPPYSQQIRSKEVPTAASGGHHITLSNEGLQAQIPLTHQGQIQLTASGNAAEAKSLQQSPSHDESQQSTARHEAISSTTPTIVTANVQHQSRRQQKYRNEQTRGALTLRSGRTYGDHRVIASTPAPSDAGAASESVQTRRIVVNHPFQTVQEVVEQEPITKYQQITVNEPAQAYHDGLQQVQQKASYRRPAAYKVAATFDHPAAAVSYHHSGSH